MINLSELFRDPYLRQVFARAERDNGNGLTIPAPINPAPNNGSAARQMEAA